MRHSNNQCNLESEEVALVLTRALAYVNKSGIETYDPNDLKGTSVVLWSYQSRSPIRLLTRYTIYGLGFLFPFQVRRLLRVSPLPTSGGVAQLACGYIEASHLVEDSTWLMKAKDLLNWLEINQASAQVGEGWGFPFAWQSVVVVPARTPIGHTTMTVGNAFWYYYKATEDQWALAHAVKACEFLVHGLNVTTEASGAIALSYTPLDHSQVINTCADISSLLLRVGKQTSSPEFIDSSLKLLRFIIENQNEDGSWFYHSKSSVGGESPIDAYHTGMILSALIDISILLDSDDELYENVTFCLKRGLEFYIENLFNADGSPVTYLGRFYPVDIYSCGQAILTLVEVSRLDQLDPELMSSCRLLLDRVVTWTARNMLGEDGCFYYRKYRYYTLRLRSLRWAQGLMCWALARYQNIEQSE